MLCHGNNINLAQNNMAFQVIQMQEYFILCRHCVLHDIDLIIHSNQVNSYSICLEGWTGIKHGIES